MKEAFLERKGVDIGFHTRVAALHLDHFRNYEHLTTALVPGFNVLVGPNGHGKTNFLEALYLLGTTRLLRGQRDVEAIMEGQLRAEATVELAGSGTTLSVSIERGSRKRVALNGLGLPRAADALGRLPCVCVTSADMEILRGEPAERRLFLDMELSSHSPAYLRHLTVYKRALEQRNGLVKASRETQQPAECWEPWEEQISEHGVALRALRSEFVEQVLPGLIRFHERMGGGETVGATYVPKGDETTVLQMQSSLAASRWSDIQRGSTTVGPHRDDLALEIGGRDARLYGSQGQQRTCVIALKLATLELAKAHEGQTPLLLLDDIFSDLDEHRRSRLVDIVLDVAGQTVLTCTEVGSAGRQILEQSQVFEVDRGTVRAA